MQKLKWPLLIALTVILAFAFILGSSEVRFPLALGLLRIAFFVIEPIWPRVKNEEDAVTA